MSPPSSPSKKLVHYSAVQDAPWKWYEPFDIGKVPAKGGHGTDLFKPHPELPAIIVNLVCHDLIKTPGHAPARHSRFRDDYQPTAKSRRC